jgi:hypothetical protein
MERTSVSNTSYDHSSVTTADSPPQFTKTAVENAQPVVPLRRPGFLSTVRSEWTSVFSDKTHRHLLSAVITVGLAGGILGGLIASNRSSEPQNEVAATTVEAASEAAPMASEEPAPVTVAPVSSTPQVTATTRPRRQMTFSNAYIRPAPGAKKAYRFAVIYGDSGFGRKKGRR